MPLFMCRWENGDCSFVSAPTKDAAIQYLDEIGNAEAIFEKAYPMLDDLFCSDKLSHPTEPSPRDLALIRATVAKERKRLRGKKRRRLAQTELGRAIAKEMDAPAALVDSLVRRVAGEKLKDFQPRGKPH